jgi:hypothetical protein
MQRIVRILISNTLPILLQVSCLIANATHLDLNARGGSERLAIATMEALSQLEDVEIELSTFQRHFRDQTLLSSKAHLAKAVFRS